LIQTPASQSPPPAREKPVRAIWQQELADSIRDVDRLCDLLGLPTAFREQARAAARSFSLLVPRNFVARMQPGDPDDPLLRQVLPLAEELQPVTGFGTDAVGDDAAQRVPGLLQKYAGRALLITTGACAVHCRYCFRRHYPYEAAPRRLEDWAPAFSVLEQDASVREVLLSGGDPLTLPDDRLSQLVDRLEAIPHLQRLRIHTRLPIVLPSRVTSGLIARLQASRLTVFMVLHANHAQELTGDCAAAVRTIVRSGLPTLNQAVLLRGVNDGVDAQVDLNERLIDLGVIPYYLHQLDRVAGAAHFEVAATAGLDLIAALRARLPGYAVPQYVQEIAGEPHKTPVTVP
jgi:EF-P beta-lysylation protein EpmB